MPKRIYVGVLTRVPVPVTVDESNVDTYFTVQNGSPYYFACAGGVWTSNNKGVHGTTATTTLVAKHSFSSISFDYSYSGERSCDSLTLTVAGTVVASSMSGPTTTKSFTGSLKTGDKIELKYRKDSSTDAFDDCGTLSKLIVGDEEITGCETKGVAREVKKKVYLGINGVARKVKKAYIGVGGVARPCFSAEPKPSYFGTATPLSEHRYLLAATTVGDYALFGGGDALNGATSTVDAYNSSLVHSTPTGLSEARFKLAATAVGGYALFGGGGYKEAVDAYNSSLVHSTPTGLSKGKHGLAATTVGDYALFGGGDTLRDGASATVDAYNSSLVHSTPTGLSKARYSLYAAAVGDYALFGGGVHTPAVDAYNSSLVRSTPTGLSKARAELATATVGDYALFGGGQINNSTTYLIVDAYNSSLVRSTPTGLSEARAELAATAVGGYALFGGGGISGYYSAVDAYNSSLVHSTPTGLPKPRADLVATAVGGYALFGGGRINGYQLLNTVDAYVVS